MSWKKVKVKRPKYQQLAFEFRKRRPGYRVGVIPIVMGGGVGVIREQIKKILINSDTDKVCREMLKTAVMESERMLRKVITNIMTGD